MKQNKMKQNSVNETERSLLKRNPKRRSDNASKLRICYFRLVVEIFRKYDSRWLLWGCIVWRTKPSQRIVTIPSFVDLPIRMKRELNSKTEEERRQRDSGEERTVVYQRGVGH